MRRIVGITAMAAALAVALSGCSVVQDGGKFVSEVQQSLVASVRLTTLVDELKKRDDIVSAAQSAVAFYAKATVDVAMLDAAQPSAIAEVATLVDEAMRSAELQPMTREFRVRAGDATILQSYFERAPVDYAAELAYWGAVRSLTGRGLTFTLGPDNDGSFQRVVATKTDAAVATIASHANELNALVPPKGMETIWRLPGVIRYGDEGSLLPEANILAFMATMVDRSNLLDSWTTEPPPGVNIWLPGQEENGPPLFVFVMDKPTSQEESDAHWKLGLDVAREALALGLPQMGMGIQTYGHELDEDSYIHIGKCVKLIPPTAADRKLAADLIAGGIDLPDTAIGECITFATP